MEDWTCLQDDALAPLTFRKVASPRGMGRGFGRTGGDYAIMQRGKQVGQIDGIDPYTWVARLPGRHKMCGSLAEAKEFARRASAQR